MVMNLEKAVILKYCFININIVYTALFAKPEYSFHYIL